MIAGSSTTEPATISTTIEVTNQLGSWVRSATTNNTIARPKQL